MKKVREFDITLKVSCETCRRVKYSWERKTGVCSYRKTAVPKEQKNRVGIGSL